MIAFRFDANKINFTGFEKLTPEERKQNIIQQLKELRKKSMPEEMHRDMFESGDDHYYWEQIYS